MVRLYLQTIFLFQEEKKQENWKIKIITTHPLSEDNAMLIVGHNDNMKVINVFISTRLSVS